MSRKPPTTADAPPATPRWPALLDRLDPDWRSETGHLSLDIPGATGLYRRFRRRLQALGGFDLEDHVAGKTAGPHVVCLRLAPEAVALVGEIIAASSAKLQVVLPRLDHERNRPSLPEMEDLRGMRIIRPAPSGSRTGRDLSSCLEGYIAECLEAKRRHRSARQPVEIRARELANLLRQRDSLRRQSRVVRDRILALFAMRGQQVPDWL